MPSYLEVYWSSLGSGGFCHDQAGGYTRSEKGDVAVVEGELGIWPQDARWDVALSTGGRSSALPALRAHHFGTVAGKTGESSKAFPPAAFGPIASYHKLYRQLRVTLGNLALQALISDMNEA